MKQTIFSLSIFLCTLIFVLPNQANAQSGATPISEVELMYSEGDNSNISDDLDSLFNVTLQLTLTSVDNIGKIEFIKSASHDGSNPISTDTYDLLAGGAHPTITKNNLVLEWQSGSVTVFDHYFYIIRIKDFQDQTTYSYIKQ